MSVGLSPLPGTVANEGSVSLLVVSNIFGIFPLIFGEMIQFDEYIFQRGWFNHQLDRELGRNISPIFFERVDYPPEV